MQHFIESILFDELLDDKGSLAYSFLAEIYTSKQTKRHPLPSAALATLHRMLVSQIVLELH
jgi:hypothetical protein